MVPQGWKAYDIWRRAMARQDPKPSPEWEDLSPAEREAWADVEVQLEVEVQEEPDTDVAEEEDEDDERTERAERG